MATHHRGAARDTVGHAWRRCSATPGSTTSVRIITIGGLSIPSFWFGMLIMLSLLAFFNWLPPITFTPIYVDPVANLTQLIWPALAVGYRYCAVVARMIRSSLLEVLNEDYIRTARAKGVFEKLVISRHALRNALLPAITVIGIEFAFLIGGLVVTEQVFNLNGIGKLFVQSVSRNDFTLIQGMVMLIAAALRGRQPHRRPALRGVRSAHPVHLTGRRRPPLRCRRCRAAAARSSSSAASSRSAP